MTDRQHVELFHLLFLVQLGQKLDKKRFALKGGCNLRFFLRSPRYSEDMDLDVRMEPVDMLREKVSGILKSTPFRQILQTRGIEIEHFTESKQTDTTQRWKLGLLVPGIELPLPTKVEFSRRGFDESALFESVDRDLVQRYALPPLMTNHYPATTACRQKIEALVSRSVTQARDVFDLHLLLASGADMAAVHQMEAVMREDAQAKAMSITFDQFKGQVLAYLAPEWQAQYGSAEVWDGLVLGVVEALGGGHETR
ncbi:MAG TPA: nucleotidyl transferase AbiEii/AbiGii toxin family protein [Kiritimatiellia bacterium]|nr:nucleotidyl transferase AbiEii/AbiGii toxin family protein [Kiritimatiellia bacterium]